MTINKLNKLKMQIVLIDNLFPVKLAKANEVLKKIGLPKLTAK